MNLETLPSDSLTPAARAAVRVLGLGNAGAKMVESLSAADFPDANFLLANSDAAALAASPVADKLLLAADLFGGPGHRHEPGKAELDAQVEALRPLCAGAQVVVILAGLGGRAGTQLAGAAARAARDAGAQVLAFVTLPFDCEGSVRYSKARQGLERLRPLADFVGCLPHQIVTAHLEETTSLKEAFATANRLAGEGLRAVLRARSASNLMGMAFADLCALLHERPTEMVFAVAEASGEQRAPTVVKQLLEHPLLRGGPALTEAAAIAVSVVGGADLRMADVNQVMQQLGRQIHGVHHVMGAGVHPALDNSLTVVLLAATPVNGDRPEPVHDSEATAPTDLGAGTFDAHFHPRTGGRRPRAASETTSAADASTALAARGGGARARRTAARLRQGQLPLDLVSKGRFDKSEPTVHKGEDLDVPTFIRRGVSLN